MRLRNVPLFLRHPTALAARVYRGFYDRRHPEQPWIAIGAIRFLEETLRPDMCTLEFGSGRSTAWFAARCASVTSVEHDADWFQRVSRNLATFAASAEIVFVPMDPDTENGVLYERPNLPAYVAVVDRFPDESLDLIVVDGQYRISCAVAAQRKLRPGGLLLVDDEQTFPTLRFGHIPSNWPIVCEAKSGLSRTTIWRKPTHSL